MSTKVFCDACGVDFSTCNSGHGSWDVGLKLNTMWRAEGHTVLLHLCSGCGHQAARLLGFCYDTGTILSCARREQIDGAEVHGPNGGGLEDIALNGVGGGHGIRWHGDKPDALPAAAMVREQAPWMRAQGYEESFWRENAHELETARIRGLIDSGATDEDIAKSLYGSVYDSNPDGYTHKAQMNGVKRWRGEIAKVMP